MIQTVTGLLDWEDFWHNEDDLEELPMISEENKDFVLRLQLGNCAKILNGEIKHYTCVDHTGKITKKYVIEYDDPEQPMQQR